MHRPPQNHRINRARRRNVAQRIAREGDTAFVVRRNASKPTERQGLRKNYIDPAATARTRSASLYARQRLPPSQPPAIAVKKENISIGPNIVHRRCVGDLLDPAREDQSVLDQLRRDLGPPVFSAQYQQDPVAPEGNMIRLEWFGTYPHALKREEYLKVVQSWDTGMTAEPRGLCRPCRHPSYLCQRHRAGGRNPTITVVEKLAQPFGVTSGQLLDGV